MKKLISLSLVVFLIFVMISCQKPEPSTNDCSVYIPPIDGSVGYAMSLKLYDDGSFEFNPNLLSSYALHYLFGKYTIEGDRLMLSIEGTGYESVDPSNFSISVSVNEDDSFVFHIDESNLEGFYLPTTGDVVLTKPDFSGLDLSELTQSNH
jgi:hypothetical protein